MQKKARPGIGQAHLLGHLADIQALSAKITCKINRLMKDKGDRNLLRQLFFLR